jgi:hypothetical protein
MIEPGATIRMRIPKVCFYPPGHEKRQTHHGPLVPRGARLSYVGPYPGRPGIHIAETSYDEAMGIRWEVPFQLDELVEE